MRLKKDTPPTPNNLPPCGAAHFVGRADAMSQLHEHLTGGAGRVCMSAIHGIGGIGKTELARQYAHTHLRDYPGGVLWLRGDQPMVDGWANVAAAEIRKQRKG